MSSHKELFKRYDKNPILTPEDWPYPANSVFNPAAVKFNDETILLVRVEDHRGFSHLTVARSSNGMDDWRIDESPTFLPDPKNYPEETWGIEDPRITYLEELKQWAVVYVAYSKVGPLISIATTQDFRTFKRLGSMLSPDDKDAALFPVRFNGRWAMIHRGLSTYTRDQVYGDLILSSMEMAVTNGNITEEEAKTMDSDLELVGKMKGGIWISYSLDLKNWTDHKPLMHPRNGGWWDAERIGLSPPPLLTEEGWLMLYHGVRHTVSGDIYRLGLALLDLEDPSKVLYRSSDWVFGPKEIYEIVGDVDNVVFPCGWIEENGELRIYYGCADTRIAMATAKLSDLLDHLHQHSKEY